MRKLVGVVAVVAVTMVLFASVRVGPPPDDVRLAVAQRLEPLVALLDELGVDGWNSCEGCQPLTLRPGASSSVSGSPAWDQIDQAVAGTVPDGRVIGISVNGDGSDPASRTVTFTAVPRLWWGAESLWDRWAWTWHASPPSPQAAGVDGHWTFSGASTDEG